MLKIFLLIIISLLSCTEPTEPGIQPEFQLSDQPNLDQKTQSLLENDSKQPDQKSVETRPDIILSNTNSEQKSEETNAEQKSNESSNIQSNGNSEQKSNEIEKDINQLGPKTKQNKPYTTHSNTNADQKSNEASNIQPNGNSEQKSNEIETDINQLNQETKKNKSKKPNIEQSNIKSDKKTRILETSSEIKANAIFSKLTYYKDENTKKLLIRLFDDKATDQEKKYLSAAILHQIIELKETEKYKFLESVLKKGLDPNQFYTHAGASLFTIAWKDFNSLELILNYGFNLNAAIYGKMTWGGALHIIEEIFDFLTYDGNFPYRHIKDIEGYIEYLKKVFNKLFEKGLKINVIYTDLKQTFLDRLEKTIQKTNLDDLKKVCEEISKFLRTKGAKTYTELGLTDSQENEIQNKLDNIYKEETTYNKDMIFFNGKEGLEAWYIEFNNVDDPVKMLPERLENIQ